MLNLSKVLHFAHMVPQEIIRQKGTRDASRRKISFVVMLMGATIASAARTATFDLVCDARFTIPAHGVFKKTPAQSFPWQPHFRLDTGRHMYCIDACQNISQDFGDEPSALTFIIFPGFGNSYQPRIDRVSGAMTGVVLGPVPGDFWPLSGSCKAEQFSGFPERKF